MARKRQLARISPPEVLAGEISPPGDKSISHRAVIFSSLASGISTIHNLAPGDDCQSTINCLQKLGVAFGTSEEGPPAITVNGIGDGGLTGAKSLLDAGNSGTTMRLLGGLLASQPFLSVITGDASLRSRPMQRLIEPLKRMGAEIFGMNNNTLAPLVIWGKKLNGITYRLPVPSAQIKSAIILAGLFASGDTVIDQPELSRDHTERLLIKMGAPLAEQEKRIRVTPLTSPLTPIEITVPGDISSAAYWLVAAAVHPSAKVTVKNCGLNPTRTGIIDVLRSMGAKLDVHNERIEGNEPVGDITVESSQLEAADIDGEIIPHLIDELPVLAVAACFAKGMTTIRGAGELRVKESDRLTTTVSELTRLGASIDELPDGMVIHGDAQLVGATVDSHNDHRLAMSLAVAALVAKGETQINHADAVDISYPDFWNILYTISKYR